MMKSIFENNNKIINTIEDFVEEYKKYITTSERTLFYRGQSNVSNFKYSNWNVESTIKRIISGNDDTRSKLTLILTKNFYRNFVKNWHNDFPPSEIEIFSKMQHEGMQTPLIDFTNSLDVALWFAFSDVPSTIDYKKDIIEKIELANRTQKINIQVNDRYSSLFILETDHNINIKNKFDENDLENYEGLLSSPTTINRALSQNSFFIIDNNLTTKNLIEIKINHSIKKEIDLFLQAKMISSKTIFPDELGFFQESVKYSEEGKLIRALSTNVDDDSIDELLICIWTLQNIDRNKFVDKISIDIDYECIKRYKKIIEKLELILDDENVHMSEDEVKTFEELIFLIKNESYEIWVNFYKVNFDKFTLKDVIKISFEIINEWWDYFKKERINIPTNEEKELLLTKMNLIIETMKIKDVNSGQILFEKIQDKLFSIKDELKEKENGR